MSEKRREFVAYVQKSGKITLPHMIRKLLGIRKEDIVDIPEDQKTGTGERDSLTKNKVLESV